MPDRRPPRHDDLDDVEVDDPADPDPHDVLARLRPPPPRTWRDRLDEVVADPPGAGRVVAGVAILLVVLALGWRLVAPPVGPPEDELPLARPVASAADGAAGSAGSAAAAAPPGLPGTGVDGAGAGGPGATATPAATEVVVHVVGAVVGQGVQRLPVGSRVVDAIDAAGGATPDADLARVNLAAVLADGQQVVVPRPGELVPAPLAPPVSGAGTGVTATDGTSSGAPIDINTAAAAELEELPGVGPATAEAIISHREQVGRFSSVDDLLDVRGIGEAKLEQLRDRATV